MNAFNFTLIPLIDYIALTCFLISWLGYSHYTTKNKNSLSSVIIQWRHSWSQAALLRDNRIVDGQVINGLVRNVSFFASTSILILAGLFASLGAMDNAIILINELPFTQHISRAAWELRLSVLIILFMYAFFKFGWAMKQHSYSAVVMASMPEAKDASTEHAKKHAKLMAELSALGALNSNDGIRAYYFALAAIAWFIHSWLFIAATVWVILILYRRDFRSNTLKILNDDK